MNVMRVLFSVSAAAAFSLSVISCGGNASVDLVAAHQRDAENTAIAVAPASDTAGRAKLIASGERAVAQAAKEVRNNPDRPARSIELYRIAGLEFFRGGDNGKARNAFVEAERLCREAERAETGPCIVAMTYRRRVEGLIRLNQDETRNPRTIPPETTLTAQEWRALADRATEYRRSVFDTWSAVGDPGLSQFDRRSRQRAICSYVSAYPGLAQWRVTAGDEQVLLQSRNTIRRVALTGLDGLNLKPRECETSAEGAPPDEDQCLGEAWGVARALCPHDELSSPVGEPIQDANRTAAEGVRNN